MSAGTGDQRKELVQPTLNSITERGDSMTKRGADLLEAHIRSMDPDEPTARERLEEALGEPFTRKLVVALLPAPLPPRRDILAA